MTKRRGLGTSLLGQGQGSNMEAVKIEAVLKASGQKNPGQVELRHVPPERLQTGLFQPREQVDTGSADFRALVTSVKENGVLLPLIAREAPKTDGGSKKSGGKPELQLIAGHRRLAAAIEAKLKRVPVHVRDVDDLGAHAIALTENLAREDLLPWEEAQSIAELASQLESAGKSSSVRTLARLTGRSTGHAHASLTIGRALLPDVKEGSLKASTLNTLPRTALEILAAAKSPETRTRLLAVTSSSEAPGRDLQKIARIAEPLEWENPGRDLQKVEQVARALGWDGPADLRKLTRIARQLGWDELSRPLQADEIASIAENMEWATEDARRRRAYTVEVPDQKKVASRSIKFYVRDWSSIDQKAARHILDRLGPVLDELTKRAQG
jgi:ParB/RepB/Spo0J family partition protein